MSAEVKGTLGYGRTRGAARLSAAEAHFGQHLFIIMWCLGRAPARRTESPGTKLAFTRCREEEEQGGAGTPKLGWCHPSRVLEHPELSLFPAMGCLTPQDHDVLLGGAQQPGAALEG